MKISPRHVQKIAVFRALQLGDLLCSVPALRALHQAYPRAEITLLGMPWAQSLTRRFPHYVHSFKHFPGYPGLPEQPVNLRAFTRFLQDVQEEGFDLVLQMQGNGSVVNPMVELMGGRHTAGFCLKNDYCPDKDLFLEYPEGIHEIERHLRLMNHLGIESAGTHLEFPLYKTDYEEFEQLGLPVMPGRYVCVHPGSRGAWRQWPPVHFAALANYCIRQSYAVVLTGTKEEEEVVQQTAQYLDAPPVLAAGKTSLGAVGVLLQQAALLISNCTGVSHMAAAFETPSIVISMDGEPERWAPLNTARHRTTDWTKNPDFESVQESLKNLLGSLEGNQLGNQAVGRSIEHLPHGLHNG